MHKITLDIETTGEFGSNNDVLALDLAVVCIHDSETDSFTCFTQEELPSLWPILERSDLIIGYNSDHFDIPILNKYYAGDLTRIKSVDLMKEVKEVLGRRLKLDNIAQATLGCKKSGSGLQSIAWWQSGEYDKVKQYCTDDVRITRDLYDYARKNKSIKYTDYDGVREIKLPNTASWEKKNKDDQSALTHTLPF